MGLAGGLEFEGLDDGAGFQEDEASGEALGEGEVAGGDDEGEAAATEPAEARDERGGGGGIEAGGGFVEEEDGGTAEESEGVSEQTAQRQGVVGDRAVVVRRRKSGFGEGGAEERIGNAAAKAGAMVAGVGDAGGRAGEHGVRGHVSEVRGDRERIAHEVAVGDFDAAGREGAEAGEAVERGGLAGRGGADEGDDLPWRYREIEAVEDDAAVGDESDVFSVEHGRRRRLYNFEIEIDDRGSRGQHAEDAEAQA